MNRSGRDNNRQDAPYNLFLSNRASMKGHVGMCDYRSKLLTCWCRWGAGVARLLIYVVRAPLSMRTKWRPAINLATKCTENVLLQ